MAYWDKQGQLYLYLKYAELLRAIAKNFVLNAGLRRANLALLCRGKSLRWDVEIFNPSHPART